MILNIVIDCQSLLQLIHDKSDNLLIVDTRSFVDYSEGHIPGAINIDLMHFHWFDTSSEGIIQFNRQMNKLLNYLGIDHKSFVVFYDNISGSSASRGVWLLHYFSNKNVSLLDGGFGNWLKFGYPVETKTNPFHHSECLFDVSDNLLATVDYIKNKVEKNAEVIIIDCRSESEYKGEVFRALRSGHIPHAVNINWTSNLEDGKFKNFDSLTELYSFIPKHKEIITYCQGGYRAANTYVVLKQLGYPNVKMYLGSWGEWGNIPSLPIE